MTILSLDIGGTYLKYAVLDEKLIIRKQGKTLSMAAAGYSALIEKVFAICDVAHFDILCVATAGIVNGGKIHYANDNIPGYTGVDLYSVLQSRYKCPVSIINDVKAAALCEARTGEKSFYFLSLGTGVGGTFVDNGKLYTGANGIAGEIGYLNSLKKGITVDKAASTAALEKSCGMPAAEVFNLARSGDRAAKVYLLQWAKEIAHIIKIIIALVNPPAIIIGGAVSEQGEFLAKLIKGSMKHLPVPFLNTADIVTAKNKNQSAIIGAAIYGLGQRENI